MKAREIIGTQIDEPIQRPFFRIGAPPMNVQGIIGTNIGNKRRRRLSSPDCYLPVRWNDVQERRAQGIRYDPSFVRRVQGPLVLRPIQKQSEDENTGIILQDDLQIPVIRRARQDIAEGSVSRSVWLRFLSASAGRTFPGPFVAGVCDRSSRSRAGAEKAG